MPAKSLSVAVPETLLKRIRGRARRAQRTIEAEVIEILTEAISAEGSPGREQSRTRKHNSRNGKLSSNTQGNDEELPPDIEAAIAEVERVDEAGLRKAVVPLMKPKQAKRLADLNYKDQDTGLTDAEELERDELLHLYEKSMVVRASALAELHRIGVDVSEFIAP